jgi:hypothetical protein
LGLLSIFIYTGKQWMVTGSEFSFYCITSAMMKRDPSFGRRLEIEHNLLRANKCSNCLSSSE